jgi:F420H(2)-dependent quinone reductase
MKAPEAPQASAKGRWWIWERMTDAHTAVYKLTGGRIGGETMGAPIVLLESVGRKSGKRRTHPLMCLEDGDDLVVVASKGGIDKHPAWYLNLQANPETRVNWLGDKRDVRARDATDKERERLWPAVVEMYPSYADYQARTERRIPLVILETV